MNEALGLKTMAKLTITDENGVERLHELVDDVTTVGRSSSNTIHITDGKSSRQHFRIEKDGEFFKIVDLGSTNGTKINGGRVTVQRLRPGDVLSVGQTTFAYEGPGEPGPAPAPAVAEGLEDGPTVALDARGAPSSKSETAGPKYILHMLEGHDQGKTWELGMEAVTLGRHASNTIPVEDDSASNYHAEIKKEPIGYVISDLGSTNGTRVKGRGAAEFEKIVKTPLSVGSQVRIGKTVLEYRNIGQPAEGDEVLGTVVLEPERLADRIAERPPPRKSGAPALLGLVALVLFAAVVYLVVKLLPQPVQTVQLPTPKTQAPDYSNRLNNGDFSKGTNDYGEPVGWKPNGEPGIRVTLDKEAERTAEQPEEMKKGLVIHKSGASLPSTRTVVESVDTFPVDPGKAYELAGALKNDGDGLYGLRVVWLKGDRVLAEHPVVLVASQEWKDKFADVRPPAWADRVRVGVFTEGREGKSAFDNLSFREKKDGKVAEPPTVRFGGIAVSFEGAKGAFSATCGGQAALADGTLELVSKDRKTVSSIVSAIEPQLTVESGKTAYRGRLYDFVLQRPTNYLVGANAGAGGVEMRFAADRPPGNACEPRVSFSVVGEAALGEVELGKGGGKEIVAATEQKQADGVQELTFNHGKAPQLYFSFGQPVRLETRREGEKRLVSLSFTSDLTFEIAPENVGEKQQLSNKLKDLEDALAKKEWGRVSRLNQELELKYKAKFPEAQEGTRKAAEQIEAEWGKVQEELKAQLDLMKQFKTAKVVREKINSLLPPWAGSAKETYFKDALNQVDALEKAGGDEEKEAAALKELDRAQRAFNAGEGSLVVCISLCNKIARDYANTKAAAEAAALKEKAEKAKLKYEEFIGITQRLKDKAKPYALGGDYAGAIKIIRDDKEFQKYAAELKELNELLQDYGKKAQDR